MKEGKDNKKEAIDNKKQKIVKIKVTKITVLT